MFEEWVLGWGRLVGWPVHTDFWRGTVITASHSDEIYRQSWHDTLQECERTLERHDRQRALQVKSLQDFRDELDHLLAAEYPEHPDEQSRKAILLTHPTLDQYHTFAQNFAGVMACPVDTSIMWGLLFLIFKVRNRLPLAALEALTRASKPQLTMNSFTLEVPAVWVPWHASLNGLRELVINCGHLVVSIWIPDHAQGT